MSLQQPETVAGHMRAPVALLHPDDAVGDALATLLAARPESLELVLVTAADGRLAGVIPFSRMPALDPAMRLGDAMDTDHPSVPPETDQEAAASIALRHGVDALPVIDANGRPLGVMPAQAIMQVLRREHVEDLHLLAGIQRETMQARHAMEDPPLRRARHRLPWLLVGLAGSALATLAMAAFEASLHQTIAVAFFVPGIVYLAGAIGTQSEAIAVRGLSLTRGGIAHLLADELRTGILIGLALGAVAWPAVWLAFGDVRLASAVAGAIVAAGSTACALGFGLPWLFARLKLDPAYGSGPLATILQDIITLLVYLAAVRLLGI
ncbi:MAG: magnesium transporter [Burkholderiales bacterium]